MKTLRQMQTAVYQCATEHGWYEGAFTKTTEAVATKIALMHSELSEALEELRSGANPSNYVYFVKDKAGQDKPEGFAIELADCLIRILDEAEHLGIDMEQAVILKHNYNKTRPYRHGGKSI